MSEASSRTEAPVAAVRLQLNPIHELRDIRIAEIAFGSQALAPGGLAPAIVDGGLAIAPGGQAPAVTAERPR